MFHLPILRVVALLALLAGPAAAQAPVAGGVVVGIVQSVDGASVPAAMIALRRVADTMVVARSTTDSTGSFRLTGVGPGSYRVEVRRIGFTMATRDGVTITASADRVDVGVVRLHPSAVALEGVTTTAEQPAIAVLPDRNVYTTRDMAVAGGTASDVLRGVPELEVGATGRVTAGGAKPQIHINGRPAPMQGEALDRFLQQLPAERIDRVEVISNPSARYAAEGQGGIVNIVMKRGTGIGVSGSVSLNVGTREQQGGSGHVNVQRGALSLFGSASASHFANRSRNSDLRENLNSSPATYIEQTARNRSAGGMVGATVGAELQVRQGGTLWTELGINRNTSDTDAFTAYTHLDHLRNPTQRYDRVNQGDLRGLFGSSAVGYGYADEDARSEWSVELRRDFHGGDNSNESAKHPLHPSGTAIDGTPELTTAGDAQNQGDLALEATLSRQLGDAVQVEAGYRGSWRKSGSSFRMHVDASEDAAEVDTRTGDFRYRETIHAAFVTASRRIGRFTVQAGVRAEQAGTRTSLPLADETFATRYRNLFPTASVSTGIGSGLQLRLSYSKRVERPDASLLNPSALVLDPLNRHVGNPYLMPEYTHSLGLTVSRIGRLGMLQFSPYYRRTVGSWDQLRTVDDAGVSTVTWHNLATISSYGGRVSASVRQIGPVSGLVSISGHREVRDASNLREDLSGSSMRFSASGTVTVRASAALNVQGALNYLPARQLPQGTISPMVFSTVGARLQLWDGRGAINLAVIDPFEVQRFTFTTRDGSHVQTGSSTFSARRATLSMSYSFGRPPESNRKAGSDQEAEQDDRRGRRIR